MLKQSQIRKPNRRPHNTLIHTQFMPRRKPEKTTEIQPMAWRITEMPNDMVNLVGLALPDRWRTALNSLNDVEYTPPVKGLSLMLQALAPEIIYVAHGAFSQRSDRRPAYWLVADATHGQIEPERVVTAIHHWLGVMFSSDIARSVSQQIDVQDVKWCPVDVNSVNDPTIRAALPGMLARWLVWHNFQFRLSDQSGVTSSWPMKVAPTRSHVGELITWPPVTKVWRGQHAYSYYIHLWVETLPVTGEDHLFIRPGIRRWVSYPLAHPKSNGGTFVDLAWGRQKSAYFAFESQRWLSKSPSEVSLMRLTLTRFNNSVVWAGRLKSLLEQLRPGEDIPDPVHLLSHPAEFQPNIVISYDHRAGRSHRHEAQLGLEAADWGECFENLNQFLPKSFSAMSIWHRCPTYIQSAPSVAAKFFSSWNPDDARNGAARMNTPTTIGVISTDNDKWIRQVLRNLGIAEDTSTNDPIQITAADGQSAVFNLRAIALPTELVSELPVDIQDAQMQHNAEKQRARKIESALARQAHGVSGLLVELPNYPQIYGPDTVKAKRDPKQAIRWGAARAGWITQFIQPKSLEPENYDERVRNGVRDLMRMLGYHVNAPYTGFKHTSLPEKIDVVGLYLIDVNARDRVERKVMQPIMVRAPAGAYTWEVCIPSADGPQWVSYHEALLALPDLAAEFDHGDKVRRFYQGGLAKLPLERHTLLLVPEQNVGRFWSAIRKDDISDMGSALDDILPEGSAEWRIARIRASGDGTVPLISQRKHFGRFAGVFCSSLCHNVYYSIQERPVSASRKTGVRQIDRWRRMGWNPTTLEIALIRLQPSDVASEWAFLIHRLRQESSHSDAATLLPEPLHSASKTREYVMRLPVNNGEDI